MVTGGALAKQLPVTWPTDIWKKLEIFMDVTRKFGIFANLWMSTMPMAKSCWPTSKTTNPSRSYMSCTTEKSTRVSILKVVIFGNCFILHVVMMGQQSKLKNCLPNMANLIKVDTKIRYLHIGSVTQILSILLIDILPFLGFIWWYRDQSKSGKKSIFKHFLFNKRHNTNLEFLHNSKYKSRSSRSSSIDHPQKQSQVLHRRDGT